MAKPGGRGTKDARSSILDFDHGARAYLDLCRQDEERLNTLRGVLAVPGQQPPAFSEEEDIKKKVSIGTESIPLFEAQKQQNTGLLPPPTSTITPRLRSSLLVNLKTREQIEESLEYLYFLSKRAAQRSRVSIFPQPASIPPQSTCILELKTTTSLPRAAVMAGVTIW